MVIMVTCSNVDSVSKKMSKTTLTTTTIISKKILESISGSISSAGFRLLIEANGGIANLSAASEEIKCETMSSVSRNSIYKQRIDAMFDDSK